MDTPTESFPSKSYALSGKIMFTCIVVLFTVMLLMVLLHLYARWFVRRARENHVSNHRHGNSPRRMNLVFYASPDTPAAPRGLDHSVLASLPVIHYTSESSPKFPSSSPSQLLECAVCLSEFNEGEKVRLLPKCNHFFHLDCIDMWFYSHATCPLCRSSVEKFNSITPLGARRKEFGNGMVRIEVPRTRFEAELVASSPASYRSPVGRLRSLTRILSMGRRSGVNSPKDGAGPSYQNSAQLDLESGANELAREHAHTPR